MIGSIKFIKKIDQIAGPLLLKLLPGVSQQNIKVSNPKKILIIRPGGMGDAILLLPALKAVFKKENKTDIDILCEKRNQEVFKSVSFVKLILSYKSPTDMIRIMKTDYDVVIDTEQSHFLSAIITRFTKARVKSGFQTNNRQKMYTLSTPYSHKKYEVESFWDLISNTLDIQKTFSWDFPYFKQTTVNLPKKFSPGKYICFFPGATINERLWPEERWAQIMAWVSNEKLTCVILGGEKEINQCQTITNLCGVDNIINLCDTLTILETSVVLKQSVMLVSTDSGILHLGVLANTPTISLFGSGIAAKWAPKTKDHIVINKNLACSPCTKFGDTPPCKNERACMFQIHPEEVIAQMKKQLHHKLTI